jgi:deoxyribodipyrimidine photo-lyase
MRTLLWFRGKDLRVVDHAALHHACTDSLEVIPVFVLAPGYFRANGPSRAPHRLQFLLDSVRELALALQQRGSQLQIVEGPADVAIPRLAVQWNVTRVLAMRSCEPAVRRLDARIAASLRVPFITYEAETLTPPGSVRTVSGGAFQVYTPFARAAVAQLGRMSTLPAPAHLPDLPTGLALSGLLLPSLKTLGLERNPHVQPGGEVSARERLAQFAVGAAGRYDVDRDRLDLPGTSRLSADLHFGTLSVRSVWNVVSSELERRGDANALRRYRAELLWREFAHHTLFDRPDLATQPFRADFRDFPWLHDAAGFAAWQAGQTGYPVVDAAARQLLREGFVHNRARMIAASFLTKHLLVNYRRGEAHYMRHLCDGDLAQNNLGWQWCAGSGVDAQPYFRIFNPVTQGERFDPHGDYVRRYVPELASLPTRYVHAPWSAPSHVLKECGVALGDTYPEPIVDHATARQRYMLVASEHLKRPSARVVA